MDRLPIIHKNGRIVERITYGESLWQHAILAKLSSFYFNNVLPYLAEKDGE